MSLFKPAYYDMKKDLSRREDALCREKSRSKLRKAALDADLDSRLRAIAVKRLGDADVCEAVLMERAGKDPCQKVCSEGAYHAAAETLGDPSRLARILRECGNWDMKAIVVAHLDDPALLEDLAINEGEKWGSDPYYTKVAQGAVGRLKDDAALTRVAVRAFHAYPAEDAAKRISTFEAVQEIALNSPYMGARIKAVDRLSDPSALTGPLRERLLPGILEDPTKGENRGPTELLALCGDGLARLLLYCTDNDRFGDRANRYRHMGDFKVEEAVPKADPDELYPALKRIYDKYANHTVGYHGRDSLRNVARCIGVMHDNGILTERIEAELPPTLKVHYADTDYYGDGYEKSARDEGDETMVLWHREG
ncbi:MAG: hypothetical protein IJI26_10765 [Clostridia bacterium]|nr:hypothetical protein [Clostridia bacterium]